MLLLFSGVEICEEDRNCGKRCKCLLGSGDEKKGNGHDCRLHSIISLFSMLGKWLSSFLIKESGGQRNWIGCPIREEDLMVDPVS